MSRIVVKVGTSTVTRENGSINLRRLDALARVLTDLKNMSNDIVLVTSGAVGAGVGKLKLSARPDDIPGKQAAAAVGQCELMNLYDRSFSEYGAVTAQILLDADVINHSHGVNAVNTFNRLLEFGVIPIVNENDSVAVDELCIGDNDTLSAIVAKMVKADLLIMLTDIDGLYDRNPADPDAKLIPEVRGITPEIEAVAGGAGSKGGTGGMVTKLTAAGIANGAGIDAVIACGKDPFILYDIADGKSVGTRFFAG